MKNKTMSLFLSVVKFKEIYRQEYCNYVYADHAVSTFTSNDSWSLRLKNLIRVIKRSDAKLLKSSNFYFKWQVFRCKNTLSGRDVHAYKLMLAASATYLILFTNAIGKAFSQINQQDLSSSEGIIIAIMCSALVAGIILPLHFFVKDLTDVVRTGHAEPVLQKTRHRLTSLEHLFEDVEQD